MPIIILGTIYSGIATPTEAAAIALVFAVAVGFLIYPRPDAAQFSLDHRAGGDHDGIDRRGALLPVRDEPRHDSPGCAQGSCRGVGRVDRNRILALLIINVILLLIGMIVDDMSGSVLAAIILLPVATEIGVHPIHFAAIVGTNLGLGNVSPPCAPMLYMAAGVSKLTLDKYFMPTMKLLAFGQASSD